MRVFATQYIEGLKEDQEELKKQGIELTWHQDNNILTMKELSAIAKDNDGLITMLCDNIDATFLKQNSHLKVITNYAVGTNNFDKETAAKLGILLGHTPDVLTHTTAETALTLLLMLSRKINHAQKSVYKGEWNTWEPTLYNGIDLRNKTLGIIGQGRIGKAFAKMAEDLWNMKILYYPYKDHGTSSEEFFEKVEVVSLHCPLTEKTKYMIDQNFIESMNNPFFFINTARGACHIEKDLMQALDSGKILGVGLDVTDPEPMDKNHPLLGLENVVIFPHIGSATDRTRAQMTSICLNNIVAAKEGNSLTHPVR